MGVLTALEIAIVLSLIVVDAEQHSECIRRSYQRCCKCSKRREKILGRFMFIVLVAGWLVITAYLLFQLFQLGSGRTTTFGWIYLALKLACFSNALYKWTVFFLVIICFLPTALISKALRKCGLCRSPGQQQSYRIEQIAPMDRGNVGGLSNQALFKGIPNKISQWRCRLTEIRRQAASEEHKDQDCAICLQVLEAKDFVVQLSCGPTHIFHECCLQEWARRREQCPLCRRQIDTQQK